MKRMKRMKRAPDMRIFSLPGGVPPKAGGWVGSIQPSTNSKRVLTGAVTLLLLTLISCGADPSVGQMTALQFDDSTCVKYGCDGTPVAGITWEDARGTGVFIVTETRSPFNDETSEMTQTLGAYRYIILEGENVQQVWQEIYRASNMCDEGKGLIGDLLLSDMNEDGVGEVTFVYNIAGNCDVSPMDYGLVSHSGVGSGAYQMNGTDNLKINGGHLDNPLRLSPSLVSAPDTVRTRLAEIWHERVPSD